MRWVPLSFYVVAACLLATVAYAAVTAGSPCDTAPQWAAFRAAASNEGTAPTARQRVTDRLIECSTLIGMPRAAVSRRLGTPDLGASPGARWRYVTGPTRDVPVDSEELVVEFRDDRVTRLHLATG